MSQRAQVLFSARDPGAAGHIIALANAFQRDGRFEVSITASEASLGVMRGLGLTVCPFSLSDGREHIETTDDPILLLEAASEIVDEIRPDVIITSLSSYGVGVDEALLATANVATFAMQDFWGDVNLGLGVPAGLYLALDEDAVRLTKERWGVKAVAVGSPKHSMYATLTLDAIRRRIRSSIECDESVPLVGFFGQSPDIPGHEAAYRDLLRAMAQVRLKPRLLLREHPKFPDLREQHISLASEAGLFVTDACDGFSVESWLMACDVVTTPFSACALDHAYLSSFSLKPIGVVLYLLCNPEIRNFMLEVSGIDCFPTVKKGIGLMAERTEDIAPLLQCALTEEARTSYFKASKCLTLRDPCRTVMDVVAGSLASVE